MVSHGTMAEGMYNAAKMVFGNLPGVSYLCLTEEKDIETFQRELGILLEGLNREEPVTVLCDISGGSPYNTTLELLAKSGDLDRARVVSGMNLPLLLLVLSAEDNSWKTVERCAKEAQGSLHLFEMQREADDEEL
ncbi:PTS sugar transporter subunit IIA [Lacrimispora sp.]|uniref:PTS sugar transporter subunit IIA n=1 Tax=Lacrimispora sp. TaxID=2719234 RepID=UPI00345F3F39